ILWSAPVSLREGFAELGPALFHRDYPLRRSRESAVMDAVRWVRDNTPADARILAHPMSHFGFYARRRVMADLDPALLPFYRTRDLAEAHRLLRAHGVDYVVAPPYSYATFDNTALPALVLDPRYCELVFAGEGEFSYRVYRLRR
ncbi:MAG TPA: hypothetical protein DEA08_23010, partial [Planctomycetes bacterium]|nr:hypothetical protein [Planctomycetota bacterium]